MSNFTKKLHEIIRVDHAGEMGAKVIYDGQMAAMKLRGDVETLELVKHMKEQEDQHFDYFDATMKQQKVRPTLMQPIWKVGGFTLGFLTALAGKKAAMTCTTAVEEVIDEHYQEQIEFLTNVGATGGRPLEDREPHGRRTVAPTSPVQQQTNVTELKEKIEKFRAEEIEHRDIAYDHRASDFVAFTPLSSFIKATTKFAIAVSKKI